MGVDVGNILVMGVERYILTSTKYVVLAFILKKGSESAFLRLVRITWYEKAYKIINNQ